VLKIVDSQMGVDQRRIEKERRGKKEEKKKEAGNNSQDWRRRDRSGRAG